MLPYQNQEIDNWGIGGIIVIYKRVHKSEQSRGSEREGRRDRRLEKLAQKVLHEHLKVQWSKRTAVVEREREERTASETLITKDQITIQYQSLIVRLSSFSPFNVRMLSIFSKVQFIERDGNNNKTSRLSKYKILPRKKKKNLLGLIFLSLSSTSFSKQNKNRQRTSFYDKGKFFLFEGKIFVSFFGDFFLI